MVSENVPASSRGAPKLGAALLSGACCTAAAAGASCACSTPEPRAGSRATRLRARGIDYGEPNCIAFGALRVDDVVEAALLSVVQPAGAYSGTSGRGAGPRS